MAAGIRLIHHLWSHLPSDQGLLHRMKDLVEKVGFKVGSLHGNAVLVEKLVLKARLVHEMRDLVDKTHSNTMSTKLQ